jgi:hypothetical protein
MPLCISNYKPIRYNLIAKAIEHYESFGFELVEVPWMVSDVATKTTILDRSRVFETNRLDLVGSGEQGFAQLLLSGKLRDGLYQTVTPCFRNEPEDSWHQKYFLKLELICVGSDRTSFLTGVAACFFEKYLKIRTLPVSPNQVDIVEDSHEIELGSYGFRSFLSGISWTYGTGLAEPRFSFTLDYLRSMST